MGKKNVIPLDTEANLSEFAKFMREEKLYELKVPVEAPDGRTFELNFVYEPATAFMIAKIYEDAPERGNMSVEENFDYMAELFNETVRNWKFVNCPRGKANYEANELSVRDLTTDARTMLERAVAPGIGKSNERIEQELASNRRKVGKGMRRTTQPLDESATQ